MKKYLFSLIGREKQRQAQTLNLIASENYASTDVLAATGSVLTNKYAEGYPGKRYYGGCEVVDEIENYAIERAKEIFHADHANVQPHSGSQANMAVYLSQLQPGDGILGMALSAGGHLTHGHRVNFSGTFFNVVQYQVSPNTELIDYDEIELLANQHRPKIIVAGASAYSRIIDFKRMAQIAEDNYALLFVDMAHIAGLVAAELHPSPIPVADFVSTTTHKTLRGPRGGLVLCTAEHAQALDKSVMPGLQGGPLMHSIAAKAVAFDEALTPAFKTYQQQVIKNAQAMCTTFQDLGYKIVSGGTDTHLFLINLKATTPHTGAVVEEILGRCGIVVNRNAIPFDKETPFITSGIRIGTPAMTTRGCTEKEAILIANLIHDAIEHKDDAKFLSSIKEKVTTLCSEFPIPGYEE